MRYHRPRAPFCGIGYCTNCLVGSADRIHARACLRGFDARGTFPTSHGWPSARFDLGALVDLFFPRGVDTLHGFRRPGWAAPIYQRVVRALSGYGRPPSGRRLPPPVPPPLRQEVEVVVIGGGVSGRATADALRDRGIESVGVLDRFAGVESAGVTLPRTTALFLPPPEPKAERPFTILASGEDGRAVVVGSRHVVVASGGYDASLLFGGNDRPGVMTADGAAAFAAAGLRPFGRAIVFGAGRRARAMVEQFDRRIAGIVAPGEIGPELARAAAERGIPLYPRSLLFRANGRRWVRSVTLAARGRGDQMNVPCDAVVLAHRRVPHPQLMFQAGARMHWSSRTAAYYPLTDAYGATTVPGLYAVGEAQAPLSPDNLAESGRRAADAIASARPPGDPLPSSETDAQIPPLEGYYRELLAERPTSWKWVACPCEDILLSEVEAASARGYRGIEVIKRFTGLGTGLCQGRYCLPDALLVLSILEGRPPQEVGFITQRPPVVPTPLGTLASAAELLAPTERG